MTETSDEPLVHYSCRDKIATITLNRPKKLNAFNDDMVVALAEAFHRFDSDPDAYVAVLHGNGRAFSSGADVHQRQLRTREEAIKIGGNQGRGAHAADLFTKCVNWKPIVTAVHGHVMGLALGITFESDLIVAEEGTRFQITETSRGLGAGRYWGLMQLRGGGAFAMEVALTGRFFTAGEALAANLINRVAPKGKYVDVARDLALQVAENPPLSPRATVWMRRWYMDVMGREALMMTAPLKLYLSEDFKESARAFAEKRKPAPFKGR